MHSGPRAPRRGWRAGLPSSLPGDTEYSLFLQAQSPSPVAPHRGQMGYLWGKGPLFPPSRCRHSLPKPHQPTCLPSPRHRLTPASAALFEHGFTNRLTQSPLVSFNFPISEGAAWLTAVGGLQRALPTSPHTRDPIVVGSSRVGSAPPPSGTCHHTWGLEATQLLCTGRGQLWVLPCGLGRAGNASRRLVLQEMGRADRAASSGPEAASQRGGGQGTGSNCSGCSAHREPWAGHQP